MSKVQRIEDVNKAVVEIASYGRKFFYTPKTNKIACMRAGSRGHLEWVDNYTQKAVKIIVNSRWDGFSNGGTLRYLVEAFAHYVRTGEPIGINYLSDMWAYPADEMEKLRAVLSKSPVFNKEKDNQ